MNIFKNDPTNGRPSFTNTNNLPVKPTESSLHKNPLLNRIKPTKNPSRVILFFRKTWANISKYFSVKHPDTIKENLKDLVRLNGSETELTIGNLWHHYKHFLKEDSDCPPALKSAFSKMEQDEKELLKLSRLPEDKRDEARDKFIRKSTKSIKKMPVGTSRLLLLERASAKDQSLSGDLFCTISRTKDGYVVSFTGSGDRMDALQEGFPLAGKEKSLRALTFEPIDTDTFQESDFLSTLLTGWVTPKGVSSDTILDSTKAFTPKVPSALEDYGTKSNRPDKLFWNIVLSIPQEAAENTLTTTRSIRLRTELLALYEAFDEARPDLDPKNRNFKQLSKLLENVSGKVLTDYEKSYLSDEDFQTITKRLKIIDDALSKAKSEPSVSISSKISLDKPAFPNVSLKKATVNAPQTVTGQTDQISASPLPISNEVAVLSSVEPLSLQTYAHINTKEEFFEKLNSIHALIDPLETGSSDEQKLAASEIFRFFHEIPLDRDHLIANRAKIPTAFFWQLSNDESLEALSKIVEITTSLTTIKNPYDITQYDFEAIDKMREISLTLNAHRTGFWIQDYAQLHIADHPYKQFTHKEHYNPHDLFTDIPIHDIKQNALVTEDDYALVLQQSNSLGDFYQNIDYSTGISTYRQWLRPLQNAYLVGLITKTSSTPIIPENLIPEAFFDNPEEAFRAQMEPGEDLDTTFPGTPKELKTLSRLTRAGLSQFEALSFMKENSTLLHDPEIRNFFDALFFKESLSETLETVSHDPIRRALFPQSIEAEIIKIQNEIALEFNRDKIADPALLMARVDLMIYYHEMLIRLKSTYQAYNIDTKDFPDSESHLEMILMFCREFKEINPSLGYASRVLLRAQLEPPIQNDMFGKILNTYADINTSYMDPLNLDPAFEEQMQMHWQIISERLKTEDADALTPFLNRISSNNGITSTSDWVALGEGIFQNDLVEIDIKSLKTSLKEAESTVVKLPLAIIQNNFIRNALANRNIKGMPVLKEQINGTTVYSFQDSKGTPIQIEDKNGEYSVYKEVDINGAKKWLLAFDVSPEQPDMLGDNPSLFQIYSALKEAKAQEKIAKSAVPFFNSTLYIDPDDKFKGFIFDPEGKITFQLKLKQSSHNLMIDKVWDYREVPSSGPWQIHNASLLEDKSLNFLKGFESKDNIILFASKGKLKQVELPRYGLKFKLEGGKLLCQTPPFQGYLVNPEGNDFHLSHGLLLEHPTLGKKLILGDVSALKKTAKAVKSKASGLATISLALQELGAMADLMQGIMPKQVNREVERIGGKNLELKYTAFDLRPHTGEICKTKNWPQDLLLLIKHEIIADHPLIAASHLADYPINAVLTDQKLLGELIQFCNSDSRTGAEAAIKLKLSLNLLNTLSANNRLKKKTKDRLIDIAIKNGKNVLSSGRRIPAELQISDDEKMKLLAMIHKKDPAYTIHLAPHFLDSGTSFDPLNLDTSFIDAKITNWKGTHKPILIEKRIEALEDIINPSVKLLDSELPVTIEHLGEPVSLLFKPDKVQKFFKTEKIDLPSIDLERSDMETPYETIALDTFQNDLNTYKDAESTRDHYILKTGSRRLQKLIDDKLSPVQDDYEIELQGHKAKIEKMLRKETDTSKQIALIANQTHAATFEEVRLALIQGKLQALKDAGRIPAVCDLDILEEELIGYFDALSRKNATGAAIHIVEKMKGIGKQDTKNWNLLSKDLHRLLTLERKYDPKANPKLLVFEAQLGLNLKELDGGLNQLDLLESLLSDPSMLVQAPTGAGKTAVLSVLESLMKTNGNNLVIQKILPPLYNQTKDKAEVVIGDLFDTLVMPLRFNLKMRLAKNEIEFVTNDQGVKEEKTKSVSIFKGMYEELLDVITNQGCVLTDYTSFPMMEAKFLQIGQELVECSLNGTEPTALQLEHYTYLRKILVLLRNKGLESMDEFDQHNRPIQKIQLDMQIGSSDIPPLYIDTSLEIYDLLGADPTLGLDKNIQSDISETVKLQAIENAAKTMAKNLAVQAGQEDLEKGIEDYLLGVNENVLEHLGAVDPSIQDKIAFSMNQFTQFLSLSLSAKEGSRYARSADGSKTVPCQNGQKHDAKHGTLYEQINYTIQSYRQKGIQAYDLTAWFNEFKPEWNQASGDRKTALEAEFQSVFSDYDVIEVADMLKSANGTDLLIAVVNQDQTKIAKFLRARLELLKSSGYLISMDPTNVGDMSRAASGISATSGAPDSFHEQFKQDRAAVGQIKASMAYRMLNRSLDPETVLGYDPEHPEQALANLVKPATAVIDGSGAFNDSTEACAKHLLASNDTLKQVGYHLEETIVYEGLPSGSLAETGFVFNQAHTRGTDILLARDAHALLTVNEKEGFRGFAQEEGRLRGEGQTYELAMPNAQKTDNLISFITHAECVDALQDAKDIYRHATQEIRATLRNQMMEQLLSFEDPKDFVQVFAQEECNALFITKPEKAHSQPGTYFADNKHIKKEDISPEDALNDLYNKNKLIADHLGVLLEKKDYSTLLTKMPTAVSGIAAELECELQVEVEQDIEAEVEAELEEPEQNVELENDNHASSSGVVYPKRKKAFTHPTAQVSRIHPAYDAKLLVTENFIPFERNQTDSKFKREPFQRNMFNIGEVHINVTSTGIKDVVIDDPLFDPQFDYQVRGFVYDIRSDKVVRDNSFASTVINDHYTRNLPGFSNTDLNAFINTPEFHGIIAQIKFLDGRTSGYTEGELIALRQWLIDSGPDVMKKHLLNEVLMHRYREKSQFGSSQLGALFRDII